MKILCFGDSHVHYFRNVFPHIADVDAIAIDGASIVGLGRRKSTRDSRNRIQQEIVGLTKDDYVCLKFGQVDIELGYYYRAIIKGESVEFINFNNMLIDAYLEFITEIKKDHDNIVICGINLPTIFNEDHAYEFTSRIITENVFDETLANALNDELQAFLPSIHERTRFSMEFNHALRAACMDHNIKYFDLTDEVLDTNTHLAGNRYRTFYVDQHYPLTYEIVEIFTWKLIQTILESDHAFSQELKFLQESSS